MVANSVINLPITNKWPVNIQNKKSNLTTGDIWLNGCKIKIGNSLKDTARNINKHFSKTGVRASVVINSKGEERLVLKINARKLDINDPHGILSNVYAKGKISKAADSIIQVLRTGGIGHVQVNYNTKPVAKQEFQKNRLTLSGSNIVYLSNMSPCKVADEVRKLVRVSAAFGQEGMVREKEITEEKLINRDKAVAEYKNYLPIHYTNYSCPISGFGELLAADSIRIRMDYEENKENLSDNIYSDKGKQLSNKQVKNKAAKKINSSRENPKKSNIPKPQYTERELNDFARRIKNLEKSGLFADKEQLDKLRRQLSSEGYVSERFGNKNVKRMR